MTTPIKLLRLFVPGMEKLNRAISAWYDMIERHDNLQGEWPVLVDRKSFGNLIKFDQKAVPGARKMVVTTRIDKKVGDVCGDGEAKRAVFDRSSRELTADPTAAAETVYSDNLDKAVKVGAVITVLPIFKVLWVVAADSCGNLE